MRDENTKNQRLESLLRRKLMIYENAHQETLNTLRTLHSFFLTKDTPPPPPGNLSKGFNVEVQCMLSLLTTQSLF